LSISMVCAVPDVPTFKVIDPERVSEASVISLQIALEVWARLVTVTVCVPATAVEEAEVNSRTPVSELEPVFSARIPSKSSASSCRSRGSSKAFPGWRSPCLAFQSVNCVFQASPHSGDCSQFRPLSYSHRIPFRWLATRNSALLCPSHPPSPVKAAREPLLTEADWKISRIWSPEFEVRIKKQAVS